MRPAQRAQGLTLEYETLGDDEAPGGMAARQRDAVAPAGIDAVA